MAVGAAGGASFGDTQSLAALKRADRAGTPDALRETARQFESLFTRMLLKSMRDSSFGDPLAGQEAGFYRDLHDDQLAIELSKGPGLGLADMLVAQLQRAGVAPAAAPQAADIAGATAAAATEATRRRFVQDLWPHAEAAGTELGVDPRTLIAHAALETGWGQHVPQGEGGRSSHNLFGIKASRGWEGETVVNATFEFVGGVAVRQRDGFRAYPSYADSFNDYVRFLQVNPRYSEALGLVKDGPAYLRALQRAGYATDPSYARKIQGLIDGPAFDGALGTLKSAQSQPISNEGVAVPCLVAPP